MARQDNDGRIDSPRAKLGGRSGCRANAVPARARAPSTTLAVAIHGRAGELGRGGRRPATTDVPRSSRVHCRSKTGGVPSGPLHSTRYDTVAVEWIRWIIR